MIDSTSIQLRDPVRDNLAAQMAAFEAEFGPVQTLPIFIGERPKQVFSIHTPGKPRAIPIKAKAQNNGVLKSSAKRISRKAEKLEAIRALCARGLTIEQIADHTGFTRKYVLRRINEHGIERGPKMRLEGR